MQDKPVKNDARIFMRVPKKLKNWIDSQAKKEKRDMSNYIRKCLLEAKERAEKENQNSDQRKLKGA